MQELRNFVNGTFVSGWEGRTSDVIDPSTGEAYAQAPVSDAGDVDTALRAAASAFETWRDTTPSERSLILLRFADAIEARAGDLVAAESRNTGKPLDITALFQAMEAALAKAEAAAEQAADTRAA